jgi:amino acid permease
MKKAYFYACIEALLRSFAVIVIFSILFWANYTALVKHNWALFLILLVGVAIGIFAVTYYFVFSKDKKFYQDLDKFEKDLKKTIQEINQSKQN